MYYVSLINTPFIEVQLPKFLCNRLRNSVYDNRVSLREIFKENNEGKETLTGLLPSLLSEINLQSTKSEADLIHV